MSNPSRFELAQRGRTLHHPLLPQPSSQYEEKKPVFYKTSTSTSSSECEEMNQRDSTTKSSRVFKPLAPSTASTGSATPSLASLSDDEYDSDDCSLKGASYRRQKKVFNVSAIIEGSHAVMTSMQIQTQPLHHEPKTTLSKTETISTSASTSSPQAIHNTNTYTYTSSSSSAPPPHTEMERHSPSHTFVILADTQLGMTSLNKEWETELSYFRNAVDKINQLHPRPKFVSACGDLVDMEHSFYANNPKALKEYGLEECERIQDQQNEDFKRVFQGVHPDIALVCLCGNHDIGNRPTPKSINKFRDAFGDEYFAFWTNGTYNIVLNNVLFTNPTGAQEIFEQQLAWLEQRLQYANQHQASQIFIFAHHPWFLYDEEEDVDDLKHHGSSFPSEWDFDGTGKFNNEVFPDSYFAVPKVYRKIALDLFHKYNVSACFSGHFHQNLVSKSSKGMDMIVTAPLSMVFNSTGKPQQEEENSRGIRVVKVQVPQPKFKSSSLSSSTQASSSSSEFRYCMPCSESSGEEEDVMVGDGQFSHQFVSI